MDTKTLVVGQDVYIESGIYSSKGKVVKVTPSGVEVQKDVNAIRQRGQGVRRRWHEGVWPLVHNGNCL
jgi:hypothetical protein